MRCFRLLHEILREIFDEAAYERFCMKEHMKMGTESYAMFISHASTLKNHKVRCC
jgi:hypothetical protein